MILFISLFLAVLGLHCRESFSLVAASGGYSQVGRHGLLAAAASLIVEHRLWSTRASAVVACGLRSCSSLAPEHRLVVAAPGLSCSVACGTFLDQGLNLCLLHWQPDSLPLSHQGSPPYHLFLFYGFINLSHWIYWLQYIWNFFFPLALSLFFLIS